MSDDEQSRIFARNLKHYINMSGLNQKDFANQVGVGYTSLNNWCLAKNMPTMGVIQKLADYLHIGKSDLVDDKTEASNANTLAAHFDGTEFTEEELNKIREFAEFVKASRKTDK